MATLHNTFRDDTVHVLSKKCDTCIFRPGNKMNLSDGRRDAMIAEALDNDSAIICHSTLHTTENAVCRGFYDLHHRDSLPLRLGELLDVIEWQTPPEKEEAV